MPTPITCHAPNFAVLILRERNSDSIPTARTEAHLHHVDRAAGVSRIRSSPCNTSEGHPVAADVRRRWRPLLKYSIQKINALYSFK
jgi:hypothetical protein